LNGRTTEDRGRLVEDRLGLRARVFGEERAILVGIDKGDSGAPIEARMRELAALSETAGVEVLAELVQRRKRPDPPTFIGKGKVEELSAAVAELGADVVIFSDELTPAQARAHRQGDRPDAADHGHLRPTGGDQGGAPPGRARPAPLPPSQAPRVGGGPDARRCRDRDARPRGDEA